jgi:hypothetical protein
MTPLRSGVAPHGKDRIYVNLLYFYHPAEKGCYTRRSPYTFPRRAWERNDVARLFRIPAVSFLAHAAYIAMVFDSFLIKIRGILATRPLDGLRFQIAISNASLISCAGIRSDIAQPTTDLE